MTETWCAGVDGCRGGWFVVLLHLSGEVIDEVRHRLCHGFNEVIALPERPARLAVDMPIGLLDQAQSGGRACDREARRLLDDRRSSVFTPPVRAVLSAKDYVEALALNRTSSDARLGLSRQAWNIAHKIREVDQCMTPALQARIVESHPELAFLMLEGLPMGHNKKGDDGRMERLRLLKRDYGQHLVELEMIRSRFGKDKPALDDVLDACALALTARRIHLGQGRRVPENPPLDAKGLRMEIWY
jgi:predicted RNase H-like nuclease